MKRLKNLSSLLLTCSLTFSFAQAENLPELSEGTYGSMTLDKEYQLGQSWVRSLRGQANLLKDPATNYYFEQLVWQLAGTSQLADHRLEIISIDNRAFNAFAAPGGIIGLNSGLLLAAKTEGELASVLAHELAHLSQRHFAANVEEQRRNRPLLIASVLASLIAASVDSSAGTAALSTTLAANQSSQLAFSRQNEREADRIGMQNLAAAGYDPAAMPRMFGRLLEAYRFTSRPPEFLTTHPLTESRVADSEHRAYSLRHQQSKKDNNALLFSLIKPRITAHHSSDKKQLIQHIQKQLENSELSASQRRHLQYSLFTTAVSANRHNLADKTFSQLPKPLQEHWLVKLTVAESLINQQRYAEAEQSLLTLSELYPSNYPISQRLAETYQHQSKGPEAVKQFRELALQRPTDPEISYQLAEVYGLIDDLAGVHRSRIEYFLLTGRIDAALKQIKFAERERRISAADKQQFKTLKVEAKKIREQMQAGF